MKRQIEWLKKVRKKIVQDSCITIWVKNACEENNIRKAQLKFCYSKLGIENISADSGINVKQSCY